MLFKKKKELQAKLNNLCTAEEIEMVKSFKKIKFKKIFNNKALAFFFNAVQYDCLGLLEFYNPLLFSKKEFDSFYKVLINYNIDGLEEYLKKSKDIIDVIFKYYDENGYSLSDSADLKTIEEVVIDEISRYEIIYLNKKYYLIFYDSLEVPESENEDSNIVYIENISGFYGGFDNLDEAKEMLDAILDYTNDKK